MKSYLTLATQHKLIGSSAPGDKQPQNSRLEGPDGTVIYLTSLQNVNGVTYFLTMDEGTKKLVAVSDSYISNQFSAPVREAEGLYIQEILFSWENCQALWELFPYTKPVSLRSRRTTIGCGDRLGKSTPGHIRAARKFNAHPVLAQQSIRELTLTGRNYEGVVTDASFLVFQEGFTGGYGADGDHLKTLDDINIALDAQMPMITLDLTEVMNPEAAEWSAARLDAEFSGLPEATQKDLLQYTGKSFNTGSTTITFSEEEIKLCAALYLKALDFSKVVDTHIRGRRGDAYDLEISIDETTTPTIPAHHLFIASELQKRGVTVNSLAPRFIGEFQKGVDYIGDESEFERQFIVHCEIAKMYGNYKVSIHSGSDKFSVYPVIGKYTDKRLHLKTAGTSWLEALRAVSISDPALYREMHRKAFAYYSDALKLYHITADIDSIPAEDTVDDARLGEYLDANDSRQLMHITYGGLLNDPDVGPRFFKALDEHEEIHYSTVEKHIAKHIELLGIEFR